ncbi:PapB/FocB family fimbrial expression transcriptional regulator [Neptuniibacter halophilus]|uniref:PapB/FocB family fimbrial expression transcriptional regulator n=1 Tax=Neptuniibacter halophilus TaxID=651666 RepID=UPI002574848E|nr:PapB/FocB family fimbrial expression transcriptional regulator [Neptuniibacter halophilus]
MFKKGKTSPEHVALLLEQVPIRAGSQAVRDAATEYMVNGGSQPEIAAKYEVEQASISRLVSRLRELNDWAVNVAKYND